MKIVAGALAILFATVFYARADDLQNAFDAVSAAIKEDSGGSGGGLVYQAASCPKEDYDGSESVYSTNVAFINKADRAILLTTEYCGGGNGTGQYLVVIENGAANVIKGLGIQDMSFLVDFMYSNEDAIFLYSHRWMGNDAHCCPSKDAILEYNLKTHQHKLTTVPLLRRSRH